MSKPQEETFVINVQMMPSLEKKARVTIDVATCPFEFWMCACEYMLHKTAQKSNAGYEKALELLCKGAMTYKDVTETQ